ncbi:hypothetical protein HYS42_01965 [Candidatus Saccharibacteria bacterium]|nr:hypothetical protein [Candidatus Saccharibacteria bacterium]
MKRAELSGLVLTHDQRDITKLHGQLSTICGQLIVVHDSRFGSFSETLLPQPSVRTEVTVVERAFDTFPRQRNAGIEKALGAWVLSVDSDELITDELASEISNLEPSPSTDAFSFRRKEYMFGRPLSIAAPCGSTETLHPRLFRAGNRYQETPLIHERFINNERLELAVLSGKLEHLPTESLAALYKKAFQYGRLRAQSAEGRLGSDHKQDASKLFEYVLKDGFSGLAIAGLKVAQALGSATQTTGSKHRGADILTARLG